jgi:hypothetical protein
MQAIAHYGFRFGSARGWHRASSLNDLLFVDEQPTQQSAFIIWPKDSEMLTKDAVRVQLDTIANEVSATPGIYYELYSRVFSARVQSWIRSVPSADALLIERVAENDPDYLGDVESEIEMPEPFIFGKSDAIFNPDWDVSY